MILDRRPRSAARIAVHGLFALAWLGLAIAAPDTDATPPSLTETLSGGTLSSGDSEDGGSPSGDPSSGSATGSEPTESIEALRSRREILGSEIDAQRAAEEQASARLEGPPAPNALRPELRSMEATYAQLGRQVEERERAASLAQEAADLETRRVLAPQERLGTEPPYGFAELDLLLDQQAGEVLRARVLEDSVETGVEDVAAAEQRLEQIQRAGRLERDRREGARGTAREIELGREIERLEWRERAATEELALLRLRLENDRAALDLARDHVEALESLESWLRQNLTVSTTTLEARLAALEEAKDAIRARIEERVDATEQAEEALARIEPRIERAASPTAAQRAELETRRAEVTLGKRQELLLEERIDRRDLEQRLWRWRHALARQSASAAEEEAGEDTQFPTGARGSETREAGSTETGASTTGTPGTTATGTSTVRGVDRAVIEKEVERARASLEADERLVTSRLVGLRQDRRQLEERLLLATVDSEERTWIERHLEVLDQTLDLYERELVDIETMVTLTQRVVPEAQAERQTLSSFARQLWSGALQVWNFEIAAVDDRPITFGKIAIALLLLIVGYRISQHLSMAIDRVVRRRFHLSSGSADALQKLVFYVLMVIFFLYALQLVSIPLTVFTVLGGVVAIGVGFGSQNVVNNFISGLILLIERPIKVGDLVDVDGTLGAVERIGLRSARIRAGDNTHYIVPNSFFLEQKVLNWTMSDDLIRIQVDVGVAYGSPVEHVAELIVEAMDEEPSIIQGQPNEVMFMDFADSALTFRAYFWIRVSGYLDTHRIQSRLRFRITKKFDDAGIVIAFPQRDLHLDTVKPMEIRLLAPEESEAAKLPAQIEAEKEARLEREQERAAAKAAAAGKWEERAREAEKLEREEREEAKKRAEAGDDTAVAKEELHVEGGDDDETHGDKDSGEPETSRKADSDSDPGESTDGKDPS